MPCLLSNGVIHSLWIVAKHSILIPIIMGTSPHILLKIVMILSERRQKRCNY